VRPPRNGSFRRLLSFGAQARRFVACVVERGARTPKKSHSVLFRSKGDTFAFIDAQRAQFSVPSLCRRYGVTAGGFYAWRRRGESTHAEQDRVLSAEIMRLFAQHRERYGSPRLYRLLVNAGWRVSRRRVARLMRSAGLRAKAVRGYRAKVNLHYQYARHPNLLWTTPVSAPNQAWVGDITYLFVRDSPSLDSAKVRASAGRATTPTPSRSFIRSRLNSRVESLFQPMARCNTRCAPISVTTTQRVSTQVSTTFRPLPLNAGRRKP
jgi:hypothetical protein